jgi:hypothetical protein
LPASYIAVILSNTASAFSTAFGSFDFAHLERSQGERKTSVRPRSDIQK